MQTVSPPGRAEWNVTPVGVGARQLLLKQISFGDALAAETEGCSEPWWAHVWPAGLRLAEHILAGPDLTGLRCLDLGTGAGIVGIALGLKGAKVTFADASPDSLRLAGENARLCGLEEFELLTFDWRVLPDRRFDAVYAADVVYDASMVTSLAQTLAGLLDRGGSALLADPRRPPFRAFLRAVTEVGLVPTVESESADIVIFRVQHVS